MKRNQVLKGLVLIIAVIGLGMVIISGGMYRVGARINTSKSIPRGLYWISSASIAKDQYVIFCPPQQNVFKVARDRGYIGVGFCPGGYGHMMKKILAAKGDIISMTNQGVIVNDKLLPYSKSLITDKFERLLPHMSNKCHELGENELLLMTDQSATSFDARYFGLINKAQVKSVVRPVFIW